MGRTSRGATLLIWMLCAAPAPAAPNLADRIAHPLRYRPDGDSFLIENGPELFNRPLYGSSNAFRVDAGDRPEFSMYLPGRGGNLRLGIRTDAGAKWLIDANQIAARYGGAMMRYDICDPILGDGQIQLSVAAMHEAEGLILRAQLSKQARAGDLIAAYGGVTGARARRDGDIGTEPIPISQYFQFKPEYCAGNSIQVAPDGFLLHSKPADIAGILPQGTRRGIGDAKKWSSPLDLLASAGEQPLPIAVATIRLEPDQPRFLALQRKQEDTKLYQPADLPRVFTEAQQHGQRIARQIQVETPDPFINAAAAALCVAADGIWDDRQKTFMHGAVAWRRPLLGWRGAYTGDALGWHERTRIHLMNWFSRQNDNPIDPAQAGEPARVAQDHSVRLARNEPALHTSGDLSRSHYDMNLVAIDALLRHLLWTGDLDFAREVWPVIQRHLAWERRLFRRLFGTSPSEMLPLYEAYCCIWASDDLQYNGGGVTHASAYNFYHNKMAARVAKLIGKDPSPYEREAKLIARAMRRELWLNDRGCFGEFKDLLGLQLVHPSAALWTFYHTVDSQVPTPMEAWQMSRFVDNHIPRIPIRGAGVPDGDFFTLPTTTWMPYSWSTNNVVTAEAAHTALAYWQTGRADEAFRLYTGCLLDSMYQGICPGNVGMCTKFDMARGESQRDFADGVGATSRALVEGLFGVRPDALAHQVTIQPGFPASWDHALLRHPDLTLAFQRHGFTERYTIEPRFGRPMTVKLVIPALADSITGVTANDRPAKWQSVDGSVGIPRIQIDLGSGTHHEVVVNWQGQLPTNPPPDQLRADNSGFAKLVQGQMVWSVLKDVPNPADLAARDATTDWTKVTKIQGKLECVDLSAVLNDRVTQIFRNEYLSPRSPYCSLAIPTQGIGSWVHWDPARDRLATADIDDTGLRAAATRGAGHFTTPQGIVFQTPGNPPPGAAPANNIAFTSQWDNYPRQITVPLRGHAAHLYLLMAGSTNSMQCRFDNGDVIVTYSDASTDRLPLENPTTWWPIDQDYQIDDFAFRRPEPIPLRIDLKTGKVRVLDIATFKGKGGKIEGGSATVLDMPLQPNRELKSMVVRTLANEVVIGLMSATLVRAE